MPPGVITLAVGAYNHEGGGIDDGDDMRLRRQLDMIASFGLDVLFSTEATHWLRDGRRALWQAARRLGMQPLWAPAPRHDCNLVIWVRPGRTEVLEERHVCGHPWWHAQARAVVRVGGLAQPLWLAAAHFAPFNPDIRIAEAYATCELGDRPAIVGGDFNDGGPGDLPTNWAALPGWQALRHLPFAGESAAGILARAGFTDVGAAACPDPRQRRATAGVPAAPVRCDRIYLSGQLPAVPAGYEVIDDGAELSDHRLVIARIELGP